MVGQQPQEDNTINTANLVILDALRGAEPIGLHLDDLSEVLGEKLQKSQVLMRLNDLSIKGQVQAIAENTWRIKTQNESNVDSPTLPVASGQIEGLPSIYLPGMEKFSSYKNSLQEYCQKMHGPVPAYRTDRDSAGSVSTVTFLTHTCVGDPHSDNVKTAEQRAAFVALKSLGYIPKNIAFGGAVKALKRNSTSMSEATPPKQPYNGSAALEQVFSPSKSNKSSLHEFAQKNKLNLPTYDTVAVEKGFVTTITFNGRQFKSCNICSKKRDAEQDAAAVALSVLCGKPMLTQDQKLEYEQEVAEMIRTARAESNSKPSLKNRLQEYCQHMKKPFPQYTLNSMGNSMFVASVKVDDKMYTGNVFKNKKLAERSSAEIALIELQLMPANAETTTAAAATVVADAATDAKKIEE